MSCIAVIDYGMGNLRSVAKGLERVGCQTCVTDKPSEVIAAAGVVLPGVGAFPECMKNLRERGLVEPVLEVIERGTPFLGICLGYQLLFEGSEEFGGSEGLAIIPGWVRRFSQGEGIKVPHMGWNAVRWGAPSPLFEGVPDESFFYFVHSFYPVPQDRSRVTGWTDYPDSFAASIQKGNLLGCQFHPEKSQRWGLKILENFCRLVGSKDILSVMN
ncbi:MAG: imidazole glycerol phosphate synthase subunit HisH [Deltaproteobacteria bacterium]|nr:imidazole glycerol phosphate synthase subunit HisH [Deltaproteobacteria bacterium]